MTNRWTMMLHILAAAVLAVITGWCECEPVRQKSPSDQVIHMTEHVDGRDRLFSEVSARSPAFGGTVFPSDPSWSTTSTTTNTSDPFTVHVGIYVRSISLVNSEAMDYVADLYLHQHWHDRRLRDGNKTKAVNYNDRRRIQRCWKPDIIFTNSKESQFHYVTIPNVLMRIDPQGNVLYIVR